MNWRVSEAKLAGAERDGDFFSNLGGGVHVEEMAVMA